MERLSGLDASFLYIESPTQPLHVCSILELDTSTVPGGYTFDRLRDELALRIAAIPEFRAKLADSQLNLDYPVWVDDDAFDLDRHLLRIGLPPPGGRRELAEVCGHIASVPLDRGRPLWEVGVIEGVADTEPGAGGGWVVMALCAAVLRWFLGDHGELPARSLVAMVPVSVHDKSDRPGHNQLSGMFCKLETHIGDPAERLRAIARADAAAKNHSSVISPTLLQDWAQLAARAVFGSVFRIVADSPLIGHPVHNLIVSNVPGPQSQLYFLGCEVEAMYPLGPLFHGCGLNVTAMSLNGKLNVGVISCPDLLPDLWRLVDDFDVALEELLECAGPARI